MISHLCGFADIKDVRNWPADMEIRLTGFWGG